MSDIEVCAAALFLSRGKDVVTENEFSMTIAMDLRWMPKKDADGLLKVMVREGTVTVKDGYVRPTFDYTSVRVPVAYRPSEAVKKLASDASAPSSNGPQTKATPTAPKDVFSTMKSMAASAGIDGKEFMSRCRTISKAIGVTQTAAGLVVLNEAGVDVSSVTEDVEKSICSSE